MAIFALASETFFVLKGTQFHLVRDMLGLKIDPVGI